MKRFLFVLPAFFLIAAIIFYETQAIAPNYIFGNEKDEFKKEFFTSMINFCEEYLPEEEVTGNVVKQYWSSGHPMDRNTLQIYLQEQSQLNAFLDAVENAGVYGLREFLTENKYKDGQPLLYRDPTTDIIFVSYMPDDKVSITVHLCNTAQITPEYIQLTKELNKKSYVLLNAISGGIMDVLYYADENYIISISERQKTSQYPVRSYIYGLDGEVQKIKLLILKDTGTDIIYDSYIQEIYDFCILLGLTDDDIKNIEVDVSEALSDWNKSFNKTTDEFKYSISSRYMYQSFYKWQFTEVNIALK